MGKVTSDKGGSFEREQCRALSLWWSNNSDPDIFWRRRTRKKGKSKGIRYQLGDIIAEDAVGAPFFETFNVELKSGYSKTRSGPRIRNIPWDLLDVIDYNERMAQNKQRTTPTILVFWEQTERDAELSTRIPLLIFKRDYHVPVVCIGEDTLVLLGEYLGLLPKKVQLLKLGILGLDYLADELVFTRAQEFFSWLTPEVVKVIHSKRKGGSDG